MPVTHWISSHDNMEIRNWAFTSFPANITYPDKKNHISTPTEY